MELVMWFYSAIILLWLWVISDKLSDIITLLETLADKQIKKDISSLADELFASEYEKYRSEAIRRMK